MVEAAAEAGVLSGDYSPVLEQAERAAAGHTAAGRVRDAARAQTLAGWALDHAGRGARPGSGWPPRCRRCGPTRTATPSRP